MKEQDRGMFENEWSNAFEDSELEPSDALWNKVELAVANAESNNFRKRLLFFKFLAAASVAFALTIGGWQLYHQNFLNINIEAANLNEPRLEEAKAEKETDQAIIDIDQSKDFLKSEKKEGNEKFTSDMVSDLSNQPVTSIKAVSSSSVKTDSALVLYQTNGLSKIKNSNMTTSVSQENDHLKNRNLASLASNKEINNVNVYPKYVNRLSFEFDQEKLENTAIRSVPGMAFSAPKLKKKYDGLWAGIGMSTGSYNPNTPNSNNTFASAMPDVNNSGGLNSQPINLSNEEAGQSFGVGINVGKQISKKIVIQGGLNYLQQNTSSYSNVVSVNNSSFSTISKYDEIESSNGLAFTDTYKIINTYQMVSIPVQAGYFLVDKKLDILLLGGFSNDLFIQKKIDAQAESTESVTVSNATTGYSLYTVSGLIGTEFSYEIDDQYFISLQPQYRQSLNSYTPEGNQSSGIEVGFKLKYLLK